MNKIEELTADLQKLENDYAETLARNGDQFSLRKIWQKIKELRNELQSLDTSSSTAKEI